MRIATNENDFEVVANLRGDCFLRRSHPERQSVAVSASVYADISPRVCTKERKALAEEVVRSTLSCAKCVCLVADDSAEDLVVEGLRNSSSAVIGCLDISIRLKIRFRVRHGTNRRSRLHLQMIVIVVIVVVQKRNVCICGQRGCRASA